MLIFFSVGNNRSPNPQADAGDEVTSPGNAKSAMTIGASLSTTGAPTGSDYLIELRSDSYDAFRFQAVQSTFGPSFVDEFRTPPLASRCTFLSSWC